MAGVEDHEGKAFCAERMAASMAEGVVVWMFARGVLVAGLMVWKEEVEVACWGLPS
jgi:hypothetical protein